VDQLYELTDKTIYTEEAFIAISALNHFIYCPRRCALVHIEQAWDENRFTAEGRIMHEHAHEEGKESRGDVRIVRSIPLRSFRLGLVGIADVFEFHHLFTNIWQPFPVEYKRGKPKKDHSDMIQLCAQAICLEEMLNTGVPAGALYYGRTHRRQNVLFDEMLRQETEDTAQKVHELIKAGHTPRPMYEKKCDNCSMFEYCLPRTLGKKRSVKTYLSKMLSNR